MNNFWSCTSFDREYYFGILGFVCEFRREENKGLWEVRNIKEN